MTFKKAFLLIFIYYAIAVGCLFVFEHRLLFPLLLLGGITLTALLKGYAKDYENQQKNQQ